jgi:hypothetical protein
MQKRSIAYYIGGTIHKRTTVNMRHTIQWSKEKGQNKKQRYTKHYTEN